MKHKIILSVLFMLMLSACASDTHTTTSTSGGSSATSSATSADTPAVTSSSSVSATSSTTEVEPTENEPVSSEVQTEPEEVQTTAVSTTEQSEPVKTDVSTTVTTSVKTKPSQTSSVTPVTDPPVITTTPVVTTTEPLPAEPTYPEGVTIYTFETDRDMEYILVSMLPQKIYYNDIDDTMLSEGEPVDILLPYELYDILIYADEVIFNIDDTRYGLFTDWNTPPQVECFFGYRYDFRDNDLYMIKDGVLTDFDFPIPSDDFYPNLFYFNDVYYGMTVEELDSFIVKKRTNYEESKENPDIVIEPSLKGEVFRGGLRMRCSIAEIK